MRWHFGHVTHESSLTCNTASLGAEQVRHTRVMPPNAALIALADVLPPEVYDTRNL